MHSVALVTGASRGIGRGIAIELARAGWSVAVNYSQNSKAALETAAACRQAAHVSYPSTAFESIQADIGSHADRARLVEETERRLGPIRLLVNNAGIAPRIRADLLEASPESFDELISTNLKAPMFLTQRVARGMIRRSTEPSAPQNPKIVFVSSISAYTASVNRGDYCLSKAGVAMLTRLFAARLAEHGIGVFEVRPGIIATDMTAAVQEKYDRLIREGLTPIRRWGTPADVAKAVVAIASDQFPFSTGEVFNVDGGFHLRVL